MGLRMKARAFRRLARGDGLLKIKRTILQSCARAMLHRGVRSAFNAWKNKHQEENRESEKRITEVLMTKISSAHDNEVRKLTDEVAHSNSRLETMKLHDGCQKASLLLRDRIAWSLKRGFDKWSNFALAKEKENDLRRTKMKIQVMMNNIASERASLE